MNAESKDNLCACSIRKWWNAAFHWIHSWVDMFFLQNPIYFPKNILIDFRNQIRIKYFSFEMCSINKKKVDSVTPKWIRVIYRNVMFRLFACQTSVTSNTHAAPWPLALSLLHLHLHLTQDYRSVWRMLINTHRILLVIVNEFYCGVLIIFLKPKP